MPLFHLDASNFSSHVAHAPASLILYTMLACPHEPATLRPTLAAASDRLGALDVTIAVVEDLHLAEAAGIRKLPALRMYSTGLQEPTPYRGKLDSPATIASYLRRAARPGYFEMSTAEEVHEEIGAVEQTAVLFAPPGSPALKMFEALGQDNELTRRVSLIASPMSLATHFENAPEDAAARPAVLMLFRGFEPGETVSYPGDLGAHSGSEVADWLDYHRLPLLGAIGPDNYHLYQPGQGGEKPFFWLFVNSSCCEEANEDLKAVVRAEAVRWRRAAHFVWLDATRYSHHAASLSLLPSAVPALAAERDGEHFVYPGGSTFLQPASAAASAASGNPEAAAGMPTGGEEGGEEGSETGATRASVAAGTAELSIQAIDSRKLSEWVTAVMSGQVS